jgi:hypothetical protein
MSPTPRRAYVVGYSAVTYDTDGYGSVAPTAAASARTSTNTPIITSLGPWPFASHRCVLAVVVPESEFGCPPVAVISRSVALVMSSSKLTQSSELNSPHVSLLGSPSVM